MSRDPEILNFKINPPASIWESGWCTLYAWAQTGESPELLSKQCRCNSYRWIGFLNCTHNLRLSSWEAVYSTRLGSTRLIGLVYWIQLEIADDAFADSSGRLSLAIKKSNSSENESKIMFKSSTCVLNSREVLDENRCHSESAALNRESFLEKEAK